MTFYEALSKLMKERNVTSKELSETLKFGKNQIKYWKDNGNIPNGEILIDLSDYFNVPVDFLLGRKSVPKSKKDMAIEIGADISYAKESLAELEQLVDRITEKVNRLKISLSEVTQTAVEGPKD